MTSTCEEYNADMLYVWNFFELDPLIYDDQVHYNEREWWPEDVWISLEEFLQEIL